MKLKLSRLRYIKDCCGFQTAFAELLCVILLLPQVVRALVLHSQSQTRTLADNSEASNFQRVVLAAILPVSSGHQTSYKYSRASAEGWSLFADQHHDLLLFLKADVDTIPGSAELLVSFTTDRLSCETSPEPIQIFQSKRTGLTAKVTVHLRYSSKPYYACIMFAAYDSFRVHKDNNNHSETRQRMSVTGRYIKWNHQGTKNMVTITTTKHLLPIWLMSILIAILLTISGLFSGLNLGLMSLTPHDLEIISMSDGCEKITKCAKRILPIRRKGNFLLCTILLGNVLVNATATVMLEEIIDGVYAIIGSTIGIVIFGEIIPQAICSKHGLLVGAKTVRLTKFFMYLTFPVSYPLGKLLDAILGPDVTSAYTRKQLMELVRTAQGLSRQEVNIVTGTFKTKYKKAKDLMLSVEEVFMLDSNRMVDANLKKEILYAGCTRIPIYMNDKLNVIGIAHMRDFCIAENIKVSKVWQMSQHPMYRALNDMEIFVLLEEMTKGRHKMALVESIDAKTNEAVVEGFITLLDILEGIIQSEIYSNYEHISDEREQMRSQSVTPSLSASGEHDKEFINFVSSHQKMALYLFLSKVVTPFKTPFITHSVLHELLSNESLLVEYKHGHNKHGRAISRNWRYQKNREKRNRRQDDDVETKLTASDHFYLFEYDKPADYFVLLVSGKAILETGKEKIISEVGPFSYFGLMLLSEPSQDEFSEMWKHLSTTNTMKSFKPDFSLRLVQDTVYLRISRLLWVYAVQASARQQCEEAALETSDESSAVGSEVRSPRERTNCGQTSHTMPLQASCASSSSIDVRRRQPPPDRDGSCGDVSTPTRVNESHLESLSATKTEKVRLETSGRPGLRSSPSTCPAGSFTQVTITQDDDEYSRLLSLEQAAE